MYGALQIDETYYWTCVKKRSVDEVNRCGGRVVSRLEGGNHKLEVPTKHNHPPSMFKNQCLLYRNALKRRSMNATEAPSITIRECSKNVNFEVISYYCLKSTRKKIFQKISFLLKVQTMLSKPAQKKICQRSRQNGEAYPKAPETFADFEALEDKFTKTIEGVPFLLGKKAVEDGIILMFSTAG